MPIQLLKSGKHFATFPPRRTKFLKKCKFALNRLELINSWPYEKGFLREISFHGVCLLRHCRRCDCAEHKYGSELADVAHTSAAIGGLSEHCASAERHDSQGQERS